MSSLDNVYFVVWERNVLLYSEKKVEEDKEMLLCSLTFG